MKNNNVRFINVKIGVQCRKSCDGVMVSMSALLAGGPSFAIYVYTVKPVLSSHPWDA